MTETKREELEARAKAIVDEIKRILVSDGHEVICNKEWGNNERCIHTIDGVYCDFSICYECGTYKRPDGLTMSYRFDRGYSQHEPKSGFSASKIAERLIQLVEERKADMAAREHREAVQAERSSHVKRIADKYNVWASVNGHLFTLLCKSEDELEAAAKAVNQLRASLVTQE